MVSSICAIDWSTIDIDVHFLLGAREIELVYDDGFDQLMLAEGVGERLELLVSRQRGRRIEDRVH